MSDSADRVRDLLEHVSDALALDATVEIDEEGRISTRPSRAMTSVCSSAGTARRSTPSSTWPSRPRPATSRRRRACASSSTRRAIANGASTLCSARRTRPLPRGAFEAPCRAGRDERDRAQGRARVPQGPRRRRDVLGGHGARPAPRRGPARPSPFHVSARRRRAAGAVEPLARILELQAPDPTASTPSATRRGRGPPRRGLPVGPGALVFADAGGSPTSAPAPAGPGSRSPRRSRTPMCGWWRSRSGIAATSSGPSRSPAYQRHRGQRPR